MSGPCPLVLQARARTHSVLSFALVSVDRPVLAPYDRDVTRVPIVGGSASPSAAFLGVPLCETRTVRGPGSGAFQFPLKG